MITKAEHDLATHVTYNLIYVPNMIFCSEIPAPSLPLHLAAWIGEVTTMEQLLKAGFSCSQQDNNGLTAVHIAALKGMRGIHTL